MKPEEFDRLVATRQLVRVTNTSTATLDLWTNNNRHHFTLAPGEHTTIGRMEVPLTDKDGKIVWKNSARTEPRLKVVYYPKIDNIEYLLGTKSTADDGRLISEEYIRDTEREPE